MQDDHLHTSGSSLHGYPCSRAASRHVSLAAYNARLALWDRQLSFSFESSWLTTLSNRFKIQDDEMGKDDLAAWACIGLDRLRSGLRFVRLLDAAGKESRGVLLVNIEKSVR